MSDTPAASPTAHLVTLPPGIALEPSGSGAGELVARTAACTLRLDLQGAHLLSFTPAGGHDLLWTSPDAVRAPGQAIRGGVPVCAPWFATGPDGHHTPKHGPARTQPWQPTSVDVAPDGTVRLGLTTTADGVDLHLDVTAGAALRMALTLALPDGAAPRTVEAALHTYLAVSAVADCTLAGLDGAGVVDTLTGGVTTQSGDLRTEGAIDRIHRTAGPVHLTDAHRTVAVTTQGARDTVVWSPGAEGARTMTDVPDAGWDGFLCVEAACIGDRGDGTDHAVHLQPGASHVLTATYAVEPRDGADGVGAATHETGHGAAR